jgi:type IV secretory pathway component VirB8
MNQEKEKEIFKQKIVKSAARSWYQDKAFAITAQRNTLFVFCIILFASVIFSLVAIKAIVEKKGVEPYVVRVSDQDQIPISVNITDVLKYVNTNQQVVEYFLIQYVNLRESYNFYTYNYDYNFVVKRMSAKDVYKDFLEQATSQVINPLGRTGSVDIIIKQMSIDAKAGMAIIRISKRLTQNGSVRSILNYQIKMRYNFNTFGLSYSDIILNPLGLQVVFYEISQEKVINESQNFS